MFLGRQRRLLTASLVGEHARLVSRHGRNVKPEYKLSEAKDNVYRCAVDSRCSDPRLCQGLIGRLVAVLSSLVALSAGCDPVINQVGEVSTSSVTVHSACLATATPLYQLPV